MCWLKRRKKDVKIDDQGCLLKNLHMIGWSFIQNEHILLLQYERVIKFK